MVKFNRTYVEYEKARRAAEELIEEARDRTVESVDAALDAFLAAPSPSAKAFGEKVLVLEREYGVDAQPRHIQALYEDARSLNA